MDFRRRSAEAEWMDVEPVTADDFAACLADLATVNSVTLARPPTLAFLRRVTRGRRGGPALRVLDIGFGEGDMLRRIARWAARAGIAVALEGIDLNPASTAAARAATAPGLPIRYRTGNVFDEAPGQFDIIISSLVAHHMSDAEIVRFLLWMERSAALGWFINDLHRHPVAYWGFKALSRAAGWHRFVQHDGPISVARSFRRDDWRRLLGQAGLDQVADVSWRVPFRFCVSRVR